MHEVLLQTGVLTAVDNGTVMLLTVRLALSVVPAVLLLFLH